MYGGRIFFNEELLDPEKIKNLQGKEISLVPQSVNYLDPLMKVGPQVRQGHKDQKTIQRQKKLFAIMIWMKRRRTFPL